MTTLNPVIPPTQPVTQFRATLSADDTASALKSISSLIALPDGVSVAKIKFIAVAISQSAEGLLANITVTVAP